MEMEGDPIMLQGRVELLERETNIVANQCRANLRIEWGWNGGRDLGVIGA